MRAVVVVVDVHHVLAERIALQTEDDQVEQFAHLVWQHAQQIVGQHQFAVCGCKETCYNWFCS